MRVVPQPAPVCWTAAREAAQEAQLREAPALPSAERAVADAGVERCPLFRASSAHPPIPTRAPPQASLQLKSLDLEECPVASGATYREDVYALLPGLMFLDRKDREGVEVEDDESDEEDDEEDVEEDEDDEDGFMEGDDDDDEEDEDDDDEEDDEDEEEDADRARRRFGALPSSSPSRFRSRLFNSFSRSLSSFSRRSRSFCFRARARSASSSARASRSAWRCALSWSCSSRSKAAPGTCRSSRIPNASRNFRSSRAFAAAFWCESVPTFFGVGILASNSWRNSSHFWSISASSTFSSSSSSRSA